MNEAKCISKGPCPACNSSDANALFDDGHSYCFSCETRFDNDSKVIPMTNQKSSGLKTNGEVAAIDDRHITH